MELKCTEKQVQNAISDYLTARRIVHWRQNSGAFTGEYEDDKGTNKRRFFRFMYWMFPKDDDFKFLDIGGILPDGRYFTVEVKATGKKPSKPQYRTISFIDISTNAEALWADSIDMFIEKFEKIILL